ncbi:putative FAD/NAD(P)-binding domain superfamily [Helianthus anomalus]
MHTACNHHHHHHLSSSFTHHFPYTKFFKHPTFTSLTPPTTTTRTLCSSMDGPKKPYRRRSSYGSSRKSVLKKTFKQEQVTFTAPVSDDPLVAIIGGGMSGLLCALQLEKRGVRSTVFDTGIHALGGRMGTRNIDEMVFDHAAQFFTVSNSAFRELVNEWSQKGLVRQSQGVIGDLEAGGHFFPFLSSPPRYIAVNGMRTLADSILSQSSMIEVVRPCWISSMEPYNGMWHLSENGKHRGQFDATVIAHNGNGKCANRLLSTSGLPLIARQMKRLELSSIWALLAAFEDPLPLPVAPFEGAFVKGIDSVSWMGNNTQKLSTSPNAGPPHCWTFFSTASFGKRNKVPQENIPNATAEKVKQLMLAGVEKALGLETGSLEKPMYTRVQLWGAALPTNTPDIPCIFDPLGRTGICGDWLLGSSLEAAAISGLSLGNHIADFLKSGGSRPDEFAVGLHEDFHPLQGHDIGQFPGLESNKNICEAEVQVGA